jgi:hypothetical protein
MMGGKVTYEPIPAGAIFTVTSGEYSDFMVHGVFRALGEIDTEALRDKYLTDFPVQAEPYEFDESEFLVFLVRHGLMEQIESWELYLGAYSNVSRMSVSRFRASDRVMEDV